MKKIFKYLLFLVANLAGICGQQIKKERISLIGSRFTPTGLTYKTFLSRANLDPNTVVTVTWSGGGYERVVTFDRHKKNNYDPIEFKLTHPRSEEYLLSVTTSNQYTCKSHEVVIQNLMYHPLTFLYLDKPIYKVGDKIKFRLFALDHQMLPFKHQAIINATFYDAKNENIYVIPTITTTEFALFEQTIIISDVWNFGDWKVVVHVNDREITKYFKVKHHIDNTFNVFVDMADKLAYIDKIFTMNIFIKHDDDQFFTGNAKILLKATNLNKLLKSIEVHGGKNQITLNIIEDLGINFLSADIELTFEVEVVEKPSGKFVKVIKKAILNHKHRNTIQVIRKKYFKPGFKFPIKIRVKLLNGQPDNSFHQLKMTVEYFTKNGVENKILSEINLKNGETSSILQPTADTVEILITLKFADFEHVEKIQKFSAYGINEYMQVSFVNKSTKIGDVIKMQAQSSQEIETLNLLIFGTNGLVYNEQFPEAIGKDIFTFSFQLIDKMTPEIRGLVFYIRPSDGVMVHDEFSLSLGFQIENSLEILTSTEVAKPGQEVVITVKSEIGSLVLLTAIDANTDLFGNQNEVLRSDIYDELTFFLNFSYPNVHDYKFEKVNSFVLEPMLNGHSCIIKPGGKSNKSPELRINDGSQHYIPKIWFDEPIKINGRDPVSLKYKIPNEGTWKIYGISIHPTKGFTVSKTQPKITVHNDVKIFINAPSFMHLHEVATIDVKLFNFNQRQISSSINVVIENGIFSSMNSDSLSGKTCYSFNDILASIYDYHPYLDPYQMSKIQHFYVKPNYNEGKLMIKVSALVDGFTYKTEKYITVKSETGLNSYPAYFLTFYQVREYKDNNADIIVDLEVKNDDIYALNILIMEVELISGYELIGYQHEQHIISVHQRDNIVVFNIKTDRRHQYRQSINVLKKYDVYNLQSPTIKIYDAQNSNMQNIYSYRHDMNAKICDEIANERKLYINYVESMNQHQNVVAK